MFAPRDEVLAPAAGSAALPAQRASDATGCAAGPVAQWGVREPWDSPADRRLRAVLGAAACGVLPAADGDVELVSTPTGGCAAVIAFTGHTLIAAAAPQRWVREHLAAGHAAEDDHHAAVSPHFLTGLASHLGAPPTGQSVLFGAPPVEQCTTDRIRGRDDHPAGWAEHRSGVRTVGFDGALASGTISVGQGLAGRWDTWLRLDDTVADAAAPELLAAAMTLIPARTPLFTSVPVHAARSIRVALAAGFTPIAAEVLFPVGH